MKFLDRFNGGISNQEEPRVVPIYVCIGVSYLCLPSSFFKYSDWIAKIVQLLAHKQATLKKVMRPVNKKHRQ